MKKHVTRLGVLIILLILLLLYLINVLTTNHLLLLKKPQPSSSLGRVEQKKPHARVEIEDDETEKAQVRQLSNAHSNYADTLFRQDVESSNFHEPFNMQRQIGGDIEIPSTLRIPYKLVHLDLKGAPPKISYLKSLLPLIESAGGNGILMEWEDTFPFSGALTKTSKKPYSMEEIKDFLAEAAKLNLEIIPLVQTFGHMEFVLKHKQFMASRETRQYPQSICPSRNSSWDIITTMIDQVMAVHKAANYVHIGCDEVYQLAECNLCKNKESKKLFLDHVMRVAHYVKTNYKVNVIIWDDMLRKYYSHELQESGIGKFVEIMIWDYTEDVDHLVSPYLWPMYTSIFPHIWAASSFKGAFGERLYNVEITRHALNSVSWLKTLSRENKRIKNFRGVCLTGWSRYDHFSTICELLPVAIPSLLFNLLLFKNRDIKASASGLGTLLKCDITRIDDEIRELLSQCVWEGDRLYSLLRELGILEGQINEALAATKKSGWFTLWGVNHNYTNPWRLISHFNDTTRLLNSLRISETNIKSELGVYYGDGTVKEWIGSVIDPLKIELKDTVEKMRGLGKRITWD